MPRKRRTIDLSTRHLEAVTSVARYSSFIAASADLGISQPAVSRLIHQAEERLGVSLFSRTTRQVALTTAGREFVPAAERMLTDLALQVDRARDLSGQLRGRLVISSLMSITHHVVPAAVGAYRRSFPQIQIQVREGLGSEVQEDVQAGIADLAIGNTSGLTENIVIDTDVRESCYAVLPREHRLARQKSVTLRELSREALISMPPESGLRRLIDGVAATKGLTLNHLTVVDQFGSMLDFVVAGLGLAIVPAAARPAGKSNGLVVRPIRSPALIREIGIVRLANRPLSPTANGFLKILRPLLLAAVRR